eukprot:scaffold10301_cov115-Skeletonema_dohrnii-CCMP3373.AAC.8
MAECGRSRDMMQCIIVEARRNKGQPVARQAKHHLHYNGRSASYYTANYKEPSSSLFQPPLPPTPPPPCFLLVFLLGSESWRRVMLRREDPDSIRHGFSAIDDSLGFGHDELGYSSLTASCLFVVDCYIAWLTATVLFILR